MDFRREKVEWGEVGLMLPSEIKWALTYGPKALCELLEDSMAFDVAYYAALYVMNVGGIYNSMQWSSEDTPAGNQLKNGSFEVWSGKDEAEEV